MVLIFSVLSYNLLAINYYKLMKDIKISQLRNKINKKLSRKGRYTQVELSKTIGISQSYLNLILKGKRAPKNMNEILCKLKSIK